MAMAVLLVLCFVFPNRYIWSAEMITENTQNTVKDLLQYSFLTIVGDIFHELIFLYLMADCMSAHLNSSLLSSHLHFLPVAQTFILFFV